MDNKLVKNKFYENVMLPNEEGCMKWTGDRNDSFGNGIFSIGNNLTIKAKDYAYMLFNGKYPDHKREYVFTTCADILCVAPEHLFIEICEEKINDR